MYSFYCELLAHDKVAAVLHNTKHLFVVIFCCYYTQHLPVIIRTTTWQSKTVNYLSHYRSKLTKAENINILENLARLLFSFFL